MLVKKGTSLILALTKELRAHGSWCGETHLQKAMYFLSEHAEIPMDLEFVLYKHGPYSFGFHDMLAMLFAHCLLENENCPPYGPRIRLSTSGEAFLVTNEEEISDVQDMVRTISAWFGSSGVMELEKRATALWIRNKYPADQEQEQARKLHEIKPHIPVEAAHEALKAVAGFQQ